MTAPVIANPTTPVGIVLIDPATGLPYSAAGGGVAVSAGTNSTSSGTVVFSNSNGVTFGMSPGGVITATVTPGAAAGIAAVQLPNTTYTSGTVNFINSNGVSFGSTTGGGVTASYTVPAATVFSNSNNVTFGLAGSTVTASASYSNPGATVFSNSNNVSFGLAGSTVTATATFSGGGVAISGAGNSQSTGTVVFSNSNNVSFGMAGGTVTATATFTGGGAALSAAGSSQNAGTIVFSNSNGVSFGMNGSTITATVTPGAAAGVAAAAAGTQTQTSGTLVFANSNGLTFGLSGSSQLTASYTVPAATVFSNSNNVSFGLAGSTVTATATFSQSNQTVGLYGLGNTTQNSSTTLDARSLSFNGLGELTVGYSNGSIQFSVPPSSLGVSTGGNTSGNTGTFSGQMVLAGGNNITLSVGTAAGGAQTITISGANAGGAQTGISGIVVSNTTYTSGTVSFSNANGISFGSSAGQAITASYTVPTQTNQSIGIYGSSQTTGQSSSSTIDARSLSVVGAGVISVGMSGGSLLISAPGTTGLTQLSAGMSTGGNTAGTTGLASAQLVLAGGANITLSGSTNAGSMTVSIAGGAAGSVNFSAGTTSNNLGSVVFSNSNGVSFGLNGSTITGSVAAQTNQTVGLYGLGNTTQNSSTTLDARTLSFNGLGEITVGYSNGSIQLSAPGQSIGVSTGGNTSGNTGTYAGQVIFAGGNNITLSVSSAAGGAQTITISGANAGGAQTGISGVVVSNTTYTSGTISFSNANGISFGSSAGQAITASYTVPTQTNQSVGLYALGNTTQNSSTTLDARTLSFNALGAMTWGYSNGSIQVSAPVTSSLSATGQLSISTNGSTISIGAPNYGTRSYWDNGFLTNSAGVSQLGQGSVVIQPIGLDGNFSFSALREYMSVSLSSSSNSSFAGTLSVQAAIYTRNASTLSLASSGSQSYAFTNTSNNSTASLNGIRWVTVPLNASMTPGDYWLALWSSTASANANWFTLSNLIQSQSALTLSGGFGSASTATNQIAFGAGIWSATSAALPSSMAFSHITGVSANLAPGVNLYNITA